MRERANGVAAVVGGSLSGLFAGIALLKGNWDITFMNVPTRSWTTVEPESSFW